METNAVISLTSHCHMEITVCSVKIHFCKRNQHGIHRYFEACTWLQGGKLTSTWFWGWREMESSLSQRSLHQWLLQSSNSFWEPGVQTFLGEPPSKSIKYSEWGLNGQTLVWEWTREFKESRQCPGAAPEPQEPVVNTVPSSAACAWWNKPSGDPDMWNLNLYESWSFPFSEQHTNCVTPS